MYADPLIVKVFYNLMDNAVRYGQKITAIRFSLLERDGKTVIVCEDDGEGVPDGDKERIFEKGFGKNTGLGLALSREILDITGITITGDRDARCRGPVRDHGACRGLPACRRSLNGGETGRVYSISTIKAIFTSTRYSTILLSLTFALKRWTSTPLIFLKFALLLPRHFRLPLPSCWVSCRSVQRPLQRMAGLSCFYPS